MIWILVVTCPSVVRLQAADELPPLEKQLLSAATKVLQFAKQKGYRTIGVLKFRVKQGSRAATDRAGTINTTLADRLELALLLRNRVQEPIGIVHDASAVAAELKGASHLSTEGRAVLFTAEYPMAWGKTKATPDLFLSGAVLIPDDLSRMTVSIQGFDKTGSLVQVASFDARPGVTEVLETGGSFSRGFGPTRPALNNTEPAGFATAQYAGLVKQGKTTHPLMDDKVPVTLEIKYDGRPQKIEIRDGQAVVMEPNERQMVTLAVLRRDPKDQRRLGLVVKVNGENTLYRQRLPDAQCSLWILEPGRAQVIIRGFQMDAKTLLPFRVLSKAASAAKSIDYGRDVGTFTLAVFAERDANQPVPAPNLLDEDGEDFAVIAANNFPTNPPDSLSALKQTLITTASRSDSRGLVEAGTDQDAETKVVTFDTDSFPLLSTSVTYYHP